MPVLPLGAPPAHSGDAAPEAPPCRSCLAAEGLCDACLRRLLDVRPPWWVKLIGEQHVCERAACGDHGRCLEVPSEPTPRARCTCHNCGQRRAIRNLLLRARRAARKSPEALAHEERRRAARRPKGRPTPPVGAARLAVALAGQFTRSRRGQSA